LEEFLKDAWKCAWCGKELEGDIYEGLFCSNECYKRFNDEFNEMIDSLDTEIPDELLDINIDDK